MKLEIFLKMEWFDATKTNVLLVAMLVEKENILVFLVNMLRLFQ